MDNMATVVSRSGKYPHAPRLAVGAVVFKDDAVLLVRRGKPPALGIWAIPGGSVRLGETLQAAAEREILEETGIVIRAGQPVYVFDVIERDEAGGVKFHYVIVDLAAEFVAGDPCPGDDALDARWVRQADLATLEVNPATRRLLAYQFDFGCESDRIKPRGLHENHS
jgi:ADP-ribose pyrophosphatase